VEGKNFLEKVGDDILDIVLGIEFCGSFPEASLKVVGAWLSIVRASHNGIVKEFLDIAPIRAIDDG